MDESNIQWHLSDDGSVWYGNGPVIELVAESAPLDDPNRPVTHGRPRYDAEGNVIGVWPPSRD